MAPLRRPRRLYSFPFILLLIFVLLIIAGGSLLALPVASHRGSFTSPVVPFFTAISAVTVTGHTVVNTSTYWSSFGQGVIFFLMLVGGLAFMAVATFLLALIGQRSTLRERLVMRETMAVDRMEGLRRLTGYIIAVVLLVYLGGAGLIFWRIQGMDGMGLGQSVWQSIFLSVSSFNNAGFSILPELPDGSGMSRLATERALMGIMMFLIILGGIGWTVLVDISRHRRFARLSLDTKLVIVTSLVLWVLGAGVFFLAESTNIETAGGLAWGDKVLSSVFHSISGRTAGFATVDFGGAGEFTKLMYPGLMFIGGAAGSVAGGIKVATFAVIIVAVISSVRGRSQAEAFGREIAQIQVLRALTVGVLGLGVALVLMPTLAALEPDIPFLDLMFDSVSAFSNNGTSTGIVPSLGLASKMIFMAAMLIGRLGPLTLALALAPREEATVYRFARERVKIG
jgi:trk system potassium uptake protein TrkH